MARRRKKKKNKESGGGTWLATFSDLMTLLLTFFILLFSMSSVSEDKFTEASMSLQGAFFGRTGGGSILPYNRNSDLESGNRGGGAMNDIPEEVTRMYKEALKIIGEEGIGDQVTVSSDQDGVYLDIQESILFDSGEATISDMGSETLDSLNQLLSMTDNDIIVEGFTDDIPISTSNYDSNWELSAERAMSVVRYLAEQGTINPSRLSGRGYGEFNPVLPNDSPENRAKNRRVNIVLVYQPAEEENDE